MSDSTSASAPRADTSSTETSSASSASSTETSSASSTDATSASSGNDEDAARTAAEGGNREAAKYRRALRETEAERDALREQVDQLQRAEVDRVVQDKHRIKAAALWATGAQLADLLDENGGVNADAVEAAVEVARRELGDVVGKRPLVVPRSGTGESRPAGDHDWQDVLRGD